jgi:uncharacterized membrane protein
MLTTIYQYLILLVTAALLDGIWLGVVAKGFYKKHLGYLMADTPNLKVAALFYLVFALAALVLIIWPALAGNWSVGRVFLYGAVLGLAIYGAYDFTNQAIIKDWPVIITVADLAWGTIMSGLAASISFFLIRLWR